MEYAELHVNNASTWKASKYYTVTCHGSQIQAFVRSKPISGIWQITDMLSNTIQYNKGSFLKNKFLSFEE